MTQTLVREQAGSSDPAPVAPGPGRPRSTPSRPRRSLTMPITLQVLAMIGIGALLYSSAADWFSTLGHNSEVSGYTEAVDRLDGPEREAELAVALLP